MYIGSPPYFDTGGHTDDFRQGTHVLLSSTQCVDKKHTSRQVPVLNALCISMKYIKTMHTHIAMYTRVHTHTYDLKIPPWLMDLPLYCWL